MVDAGVNDLAVHLSEGSDRQDDRLAYMRAQPIGQRHVSEDGEDGLVDLRVTLVIDDRLDDGGHVFELPVDGQGSRWPHAGPGPRTVNDGLAALGIPLMHGAYGAMTLGRAQVYGTPTSLMKAVAHRHHG